MQRLTVTVDEELAAFVRAEVERGRAASVSAYVGESLRMRAEDRLALLAELDQEADEEPSDPATLEQLARATGQDVAWVRDALGLRR